MSMRGEPTQTRVLEYVRDYWPENQTLWKFIINSLVAGGHSVDWIREQMLTSVPDTELMRCMNEYYELSRRF